MLSRVLTTKEQFVLVGVAAAICVGGVAVYLSRSSPQSVVKDSQAAADPAPAVDERKDAAAEPPPEAVVPVPKPGPSDEPLEPVAVYIGGAVVRPGVYTLDGGSRVSDLIEAADGLMDHADVSDINMAAPLLDGTTLTIPGGELATVEGNRLIVRGAHGEVVRNPPQYTISGWSQPRNVPAIPTDPGTARVAASTRQGGLLDLNHATLSELETLPGIGPKRAQDIINYRSQQPFLSVDDLVNIRGIGPKTLESLRPLVTVGSS